MFLSSWLCSYVYAARIKVASSSGFPMICNPIGMRLLLNPHGTEIPGSPARFNGTVHISIKYICRGLVIDPILYAGVGAAGVTAHVGATRYAGRKGSMGMLRNMYEKMIKTSKVTAQNNEIATGVWAKLVRDTKRFSNHALNQLKNLENVKFIGPIIKSPITKKITGVFGAFTAVFVLISGLSEASNNGKIAVADLKERLDLAA